MAQYTRRTKQGYTIAWKTEYDGRVYAIAYREICNEFVICLGYDEKDGTWAQGHYGFKSLKSAQKELFKYLAQ